MGQVGKRVTRIITARSTKAADKSIRHCGECDLAAMTACINRSFHAGTRQGVCVSVLLQQSVNIMSCGFSCRHRHPNLDLQSWNAGSVPGRHQVSRATPGQRLAPNRPDL